jgi:hypothetical protein
MAVILKSMATMRERYAYIKPWSFFNCKNKPKLASIFKIPQ